MYEDLEDWVEDNRWIKKSELYKNGKYLVYEDMPIVNFYDSDVSNINLFKYFIEVVDFWKLDNKYFPLEIYVLLFSIFRKKSIAKEFKLIEKKYFSNIDPISIGKQIEDSLNINNIKFVNFFLKNTPDISNEEFLSYMIKINNFEMVKYLIENGAEITEDNLIKATIYNDFEMFMYLIEHGAEITEQVLSEATSNEKFEIVKYLVEHDVEITDEILSEVAYNDKPEMFIYLIKHGGEITENVINGVTTHDNFKITEYLVTHEDNEKINKKILDNAVKNDDIEMIEIIENNLKIIDIILIYAVRNNNSRIIKFLINNDANITCEALNYAVYNKNIDILEYLIENDRNMNIQDLKCDDILLKTASRENNFEMFKYLINNGAKINDLTTIIDNVLLYNNSLNFFEYLIDYSIRYNIEYDKNYLLFRTLSGRIIDDYATFFAENGATFEGVEDIDVYIDRMFMHKNYEFFRFILKYNLVNPAYIENIYDIEEFPEDIQDMIINNTWKDV